ncbi:energy transducer TonB [Parapedobacter sp. ISTM3]|uniref:Protein TonB, links inner and outer membranes n=1 Tax=Parapedobacter luteus TaxID=623280 RepID=A0A1T5CCA1_9SPHI|nr:MULTISPECIES: energy transducer TonB [Parapedobacter]MBK1439069.1 energy transducer TonB [Parapedobacter sp. ISTM3]SKB57087.1 protein TonB, links inner and outer membranes [Parapedobacter luteus]
MGYYHLQEDNNYPKALWISGGVMGGLLLLSFFIMIGSAFPEIGTGGIIVNYGTAEVGMGDDYMTVDEASMDPNANHVRPDRIDPQQETQPTPSQQVTERTVATQDMDDAPAVVANETKKANAEEATVEKKESKPAVNPNALYTGKRNNAAGRGDGTGAEGGNQGSAQGDPLAANYGEGGSGFGTEGLTIANRRWVVPPQIEDNGQQAGVVAVEVHVAPNGTITYARAGVKGTTLPDRSLWEKCERALRGARLNELERAPTVQKAIVPVRFRLK